MPPDPKIINVAELEPYGLTIDSLKILDDMGFLTIDDMEYLTIKEIQDRKGVGPVAIRNIKTTLRNYLAGRKVRTNGDMCFPKHWPTPRKRKKK